MNLNSHLTAKDRIAPSLPVRPLYDRKLIVGDVLDFGCGFGKDVEFLLSKKINAVGYDPYYFPSYPTKKFDTIICFYVLNVLLPDEQTKVLMRVSNLLKSGGKAYFAVRRDIQHDGFRTHYIHGKSTYQCFVKLPYKSIFLNENTEFYEYQHVSAMPSNNEIRCPFCKPNSRLVILAETSLSYSILDGFPVSAGHALVIPKRHVDNYFNLTFQEQTDLVQVVNYVQEIITLQHNPDGFTTGSNIGKVAGQRINHTAIHLIPRYAGDCINPSGGIRNIIHKK